MGHSFCIYPFKKILLTIVGATIRGHSEIIDGHPLFRGDSLLSVCIRRLSPLLNRNEKKPSNSFSFPTQHQNGRMKVLSVTVWAVLVLPTEAFQAPWPSLVSSTKLSAARGMGMAAPSKNKSGTKKGNGMGKKIGIGEKSGSSTPFDANASLIRLEKRYNELMINAAKQMAKDDDEVIGATTDETITSEYVVVARSKAKGGVADWVPFAQICLSRPESEFDNSKEVFQAVISTYCRELSHLAAFGAPVFSTVARSDLQYGIEPVDSFHKHVFEAVIEGAVEQDMTKSLARETLGLGTSESDKAIIKQAYRKLSFSLHPDRVEGNEEEKEAAAEQFGRVKLAYDTLMSGIRQEGVSWYESLGGRARTGFVGPISLLPMSAAQEQMTQRKAEAAMVGLSTDIIQTFVARNLRSS